jgi:Zn finger protein HypA/HybF involved in hydrogenase expression
LKENKHYEVQTVGDDFEHKGLKFQYMGGHGKLSCNDCDFQQPQTSFIHGISTSRSGYQCQACGKLTSNTRTQNDTQETNRAALVCECGGKLERDQVLFCPDCKSTNLSYSMEYIT